MSYRDPALARPPRPWDQRSLAIPACVAVCLVSVFAYAGSGWIEVLFRLLTDGVLLLVWLTGAYGIGSVVPLPAARSAGDRPLRAVTRVALGLGALSLLALGLGLAGALNRVTALALLGAGVAVAAARLLRAQQAVAASVRAGWTGPAGVAWLWALVMPLLGMALVAALVPPGVLWGDEPNGYDVVEYHLQVPREWYEAGRMTGLHHNVFSYFPFNVEMHYLLAMHVRGGPWSGMYLAQLMHVGFVALSAAAVYAAGRAAGADGRSATVAGVCAGATPWLTLLAPVAYNEGGLLLYGTLAIGWTLVALRETGHRAAAMAVAGAMAGFACGVKLTAGPTLLLPLPLALLAITAARRERVRTALVAAVAFVAVGTTVFAPWPARNVAWTGNPVFPEAQRFFGRAHFTEAQSTRWAAAHSPRPDQQGVGARLASAWDQMGRDARYGYLLLPLALACMAATWRRPETWLLGGLLVSLLAFWLAFTHLQGRFFVLAVPVAALLVAQVSGRRQAIATGALAAVLALIGFGVMHERMNTWLHEKQVARVLGVETLSQFMTPEAAEHVPADVALALVGDARAFCYQRPMSRLRYRTVFDVGAGGDWLTAWLGRAVDDDDGDDRPVILIDPAELQRFTRTYRGLPPVPPEVQRRTEPFLHPADR